MENQPNDGAEIYRLTILTLELKIANGGKNVTDFINASLHLTTFVSYLLLLVGIVLTWKIGGLRRNTTAFFTEPQKQNNLLRILPVMFRNARK